MASSRDRNKLQLHGWSLPQWIKKIMQGQAARGSSNPGILQETTLEVAFTSSKDYLHDEHLRKRKT